MLVIIFLRLVDSGMNYVQCNMTGCSVFGAIDGICSNDFRRIFELWTNQQHASLGVEESGCTDNGSLGSCVSVQEFSGSASSSVVSSKKRRLESFPRSEDDEWGSIFLMGAGLSLSTRHLCGYINIAWELGQWHSITWQSGL